MGRRAKIGILIAMLALSVGFAAITTTLVVNGTLSVGPDGEGFDSDVIFTKARTTGTAFISADGKSITFNADLMDIGQEQDLRYEITNKSRQYNATGTIECGFVDESNRFNDYITITPTPEEFEIEASRKKSGHVTVKMIQSFIGDGENDFANIEFKCTIKMEAGEREDLAPEMPELYKDEVLNGADPVLNGDLVPISLTNDGKVIYADLYDKWYDYSTKRWANAVLLTSEAALRYDVGDVIKEEDIESYFVWIPRYKYKLWNVNQASGVLDAASESVSRTIDIVFETKDVEASTGTQNDEWLTHPAFTNFDVNGLWVGKFETGYKGATTLSEVGVANSSDKIIVKPNVVSFSYANSLKNIFNIAYNYNRALDSHMMKNTEWGAVAYLSHSNYGINARVRINNNSDRITGYAAVNEPTCYQGTNCNKYGVAESLTQPYNTEVGYLASTTGNITGIYDMSGGEHEMVASYSGGGRSGVNKTFVDEHAKYFDVYPSSSRTQYENRKLGDATGEMGPFYKSGANSVNSFVGVWYGEAAYFLDNFNYWTIFYRGGTYRYGSQAGQFAFTSWDGSVGNSTFRMVLSPQ